MGNAEMQAIRGSNPGQGIAGTPVKSHIQGELLELTVTGFTAASAILVRADDAANATFPDSENGQLALQPSCPQQVAAAENVVSSGSSMSVYFRPACTGKTGNIKLQFVACTGYGKPVELTELELSPEMDGN